MRMTKIGAVMTFAMAQVALAKQHASRRFVNRKIKLSDATGTY